MKIYKLSLALIIIILGIPIFLVGCGTFEVGIETISPPTPFPVDTPTEEVIVPAESPAPSPTPEIAPTPEEALPDVPNLVSIGRHAPFGSAEMGLLVQDNDEFTVQPSPFDYAVLWDYSPLSGKLVYSSEFFHTSESNNIAVSDLWVYDYQTGTTEKWLDDNVTRAQWAPDGEQVTVALYNPNTEQIDLVLVSGPDQVELIAACASTVFSWSPAGDLLAYVNAILWLNLGVDESCLGTYLVTFPNGLSGVELDVSRVSDFSGQDFGGSHFLDQPSWALEQNALIYPDSPFWVIPLDGSPAFVPQTPGGEEPMNLPRPFGSIWSSQLNQLVGGVDSGPAGFGGVWVYQLSEDLSQIESYYRIGDAPEDSNADIFLVGWWSPGESVLVLETKNPNLDEYLGEDWGAARVWSLVEEKWLDETGN